MDDIYKNNWRAPFLITILSAYFYAFMEWLFFVTKPSSLAILTPFEKLEVLFITGGVVALLLLVGVAVIWLLTRRAKNPKWKVLAYIPSAFILAVTTLILFDNFTYTVFKFGVTSSGGVFRAVYALGFLIVFWRMVLFAQRTALRLPKFASTLTIGLLTVSTAGILATFFSLNPSPNSDSPTASTDLPDIIILGGDGLSATYMSMYGYSQETTPFLEQLTETSLVAENAFNNASSTTASTTSALTGKEPILTDVLRYPDILSGNDSFEHLPGILKRYGYHTVEIGVPSYVDAVKLNMLDGFDIVNNQSLNRPASALLRKVLGNAPPTYFIQTITERVSERLFHIFYIREMNNPLAGVTSPKSRMSDAEKKDQIIQLMDEADRPLFIFAHFMDTHGPEFSSPFQVFSNGPIKDNKRWSVAHYKDALLSYDASVREVYEYLEQTGKLDNTILVIYTDHGYGYAMNHRIPLLIHFPGSTPAGTRTNNVQVLDLPVTLLDYLDIPTPAWMVGTSMLGDEPPADREIFAIKTGSPKRITPPFHKIKIVQLTVCQKWYALNVQENEWRSGMAARHTSTCESDMLPTDEEARQRILEYLEQHGYDISSLQEESE
ncbi:MAG TPA: sulfatase-like hydrolase/transferase [Anaerolineales bacterium]|nr:sulfatase-like hydrolase/transferase [Anaerolineales bacterium]